MADWIPIVNAALSRSGNNRITSFDDGSTEAGVAGDNYETAVVDLLSVHPWRFACTQERANKLDGVPLTNGAAAFQEPVESLRPLGAFHGEGMAARPVRWRLWSNRILIESDLDELVVSILWRAPEVRWPGYFREIVIIQLEAHFLRALNEDHANAARREEHLHRVKLPRARTADAQQGAPLPPMRSRLAEARAPGRPAGAWG